MRSSQIRNTLLASGAAVALAATSGAASADDLSTLRDQLQKLQSKVAKIEADRTAKARRVAAAAAVEAGDRPRTWKLPGTNTSMLIGGYVKLDIVMSSRPNTFFANTVASNFPLGTQGSGLDIQMHAKQSRIFFRTWTPTDWGELTTHIEIDFFNTGGRNADNSAQPRLRHAWACLGPVCAGQTWTLFMPIWSYPEVLDFGGPVGSVFNRKASIRFTHSFGGGWIFQIALENPKDRDTLGIIAGNGGGDSIIRAGLPFVGWENSGAVSQNMPEVVVNIMYAFRGTGMISRGRVGLQGAVGLIEAGNLGVTSKKVKWAVGLAGGFIVGKRVRFGLAGWIGQGYNDLGFGGNQATSGSAFIVGTSLRTFLHYSGLAWVQFRWTDTLRSTVSYSYFGNKHQNAVAKTAGSIYSLTLTPIVDWSQNINVNLIWSPVPQVNIGVEYIWTYVAGYFAANTQGHRVQLSFQYKF